MTPLTVDSVGHLADGTALSVDATDVAQSEAAGLDEDLGGQYQFAPLPPRRRALDSDDAVLLHLLS